MLAATVNDLRAKTDRDLQVIISRRLERALTRARHSDCDQAYRDMAEARQLLDVVEFIPETDRHLMNLRLEQLARLLAADHCCAAAR